MKVCVIGTGYVGLVSGACFAESGNTVYAVDKDTAKIAALRDGKIPIYEPGLEELVLHNAKQNRLLFTTDLAEGLNAADVCFIAVGTPQDEDGSADLSAVFGVCEEICRVATKPVIIATKSTVPVGTGDKIEALFREKLKHAFSVFSNPEFLKEGDAINDFMKPDRIVVGTDDEKVIAITNELYSPFNHQRNRMVFMSRKSAEITKYAANTMLALRISFMNEMANFCELVGGNINDIRHGIGSDPRIGPSFLYPGLGYGGSCFPKDVRALARTAEEHGLKLKTVEALDEVNKEQPLLFCEKIAQKFGGRSQLKGKTIAIWGLAFKARTDDIRYSPALKIVDWLKEQGAILNVFDPEAIGPVQKVYGNSLHCKTDKMDCLVGADALVIGTEWNEFRSPDFAKMKTLMKRQLIADGRNLYSAKTVRDAGFEYFGVGLPKE